MSMALLQPPVPAAPEPVPQLLRDLIHDRTGIYFPADRIGAMIEKLASRVLARGCQTYLDYYYILKYEDKGPEEWLRVMDAFSVPETYFWREGDQLQALVNVLVPEWFRRSSSTPLRIWSAACATGEEPYSIVMALHEAGWSNHPITITASDASEAALEKARAGLYRERSFRSLPAKLREKYFRPSNGLSRIDAAIASRVTFQRANLVAAADIRPLARVDVIFCRNVFIYFSPEAIARVVASFAQQTAPGSHLFVGASESLLKLTDDYELTEIAGAFGYRRKEQA